MQNTSFDLIVIGAGPGGYVGAIRAGKDVIIGIDFGRTPSAVFSQQTTFGRWIIFHEVKIGRAHV